MDNEMRTYQIEDLDFLSDFTQISYSPDVRFPTIL